MKHATICRCHACSPESGYGQFYPMFDLPDGEFISEHVYEITCCVERPSGCSHRCPNGAYILDKKPYCTTCFPEVSAARAAALPFTGKYDRQRLERIATACLPIAYEWSGELARDIVVEIGGRLKMTAIQAKELAIHLIEQLDKTA